MRTEDTVARQRSYIDIIQPKYARNLNTRRIIYYRGYTIVGRRLRVYRKYVISYIFMGVYITRGEYI